MRMPFLLHQQQKEKKISFEKACGVRDVRRQREREKERETEGRQGRKMQEDEHGHLML